jgi:hypothetical protein
MLVFQGSALMTPRLLRYVAPVAIAGWVSLVGCQEQIGEPIVAAAGATSGDEKKPGEHGGEGGSDGSTLPISPAGSLCSPCETHRDCGDESDHCLTNEFTGERFCGRDCLEGDGCPDDFLCLNLGDDGTMIQCGPVSASCTDPSSTAGVFGLTSLLEMRAYVVTRLNQERAARRLPLLTADACLEELAQRAVVDLGQVVFYSSVSGSICDPANQTCNCDVRKIVESVAELASGDWQQWLDSSISEVLTQPAGDHVLSDTVTRVGVGVVQGQRMLWQVWKFGS